MSIRMSRKKTSVPGTIFENSSVRASRFSVQSHGASHRPFSKLDPAEQEEELIRSQAVLEAGLGKPAQVFAYPYGDWGANPAVEQSWRTQ